ncbi:P-loop containing nucleoside triphosphate hydrolase protein, partial [Coniophora puteana RWD-64-598 SS2]
MRVALPHPGQYDKEAMQLQILTWNHDLLDELLLEAKKDYLASFEDKICVYVANPSSSDWIPLATRPKRPIQSIILDSDVQNMVLEDVQEFMRSKAWYTERGIPFRRGYLLHGSPGSGKTSLIHSIAGELGLDVFLISLSARGMDDTKLAELIAYLPEQCITLMEDIDAAFLHGVSRDGVDGVSSPQAQSHSGGATVTLSGLLNALDGIGAQEGRILFATTNRYAALDPALCRPGRMDLHVEFRHASRRQAEELFTRFFNIGTSPPPPAELEKQLSAEDINDLAIRFAESIPEHEVSMATLQGFLMMYKHNPVDAAYEVWAYV